MIEILRVNWQLYLMASLTLGLAPFNPPHLFEKIAWIARGEAIGGDKPMRPLDWFDLVLHGTPWVLLIISGIINLIYLV